MITQPYNIMQHNSVLCSALGNHLDVVLNQKRILRSESAFHASVIMLKIMDYELFLCMPALTTVVLDSVGVGVVITLCSLFEFVMVQTSNRMRGIMMGLHGSNYAWCQWNRTTDQAVPSAPSSHTQLCVLLLPVTIATHAVDTSSVCYSCQVLQAQREGQTIIHAIVEEHYERYFDLEEEYMRDIAKQTLKVIVSMAPALTDAVLVNSLNNNYALGGRSPKATRVCVCVSICLSRAFLCNG